MRTTNFTIMQGGKAIESAAVLELAVRTAKTLSAETGKPVSVVARLDDGTVREAVFNPDGTNDKIWNIDKGSPLAPVVGRVYTNRGGGKYLCVAPMAGPGPAYYNPAGGSSDTSGTFRNISSGWTFVAKGVIRYVDGTIEWDHSSGGFFDT